MDSALAELFKHNLWANLIVLDKCSELSDEQLDTEVSGTYGSILNTLLHIVGAEERYIDRLLQRPWSPLREREDFKGFADLRAAAEKSGAELIKIAESCDPNAILRGTNRDGKRYEIAAPVMLTQAINHSTEHRTHINSILTHLGIEPCDVDGWAYGDAHGQVKYLE
jgi:uncharacterized damage-inducible protein DinB